MLVHQAFRFELDPNNQVRSALSSNAGAARFAYNWGLATVIEALAARRAFSDLALRQRRRSTSQQRPVADRSGAHGKRPTNQGLRRSTNA